MNLEPAVSILAKQEAREPQGSSCPHFPHSDSSAGVIDVLLSSAIPWVLGNWTQILMTMQPPLYLLSHPPAPKLQCKKRWNDPYLEKRTTDMMWAGKKSFLRRNRLWDFPLYTTLGAGVQSCIQTSRGPLPMSAPSGTWADSIFIISKVPGVTVEGIKFWDATPERLFSSLDGT